MKIILYILGLLLEIGGLLTFVSISFTNIYFEENLAIHFILVAIGFILIFLGVILFYYFIKEEKTYESSR